MTNYLPNSDAPDVRDYLFVDRQRVGSLLSQFTNGLPEDRTEQASRSFRLKASLSSVFSFENDRGLSDSQTLALADLHVSQLEEAAEALSMLRDVSALVHKRKNWLRGKVRSKIEPGMLLRISAPTQISDISSIIDSFDRLNEVVSSEPDETMKQVLPQIAALYGESITVSIYTTDPEDFDVGFIGEVPADFDFGPMRKQLLLSQVGPSPVELTTLMQISAVPTERDTRDSSRGWQSTFEKLSGELVDGEQLDRRRLDQMISAMGGLLAHHGFVAAPRWPAISIIPLAIYRNVGPIPDLDSD